MSAFLWEDVEPCRFRVDCACRETSGPDRYQDGRRKIGQAAVVIWLFVIPTLWVGSASVAASVTLTNSDPSAVAAAINVGGTVQLAFDGTIRLLETLVIATNTTVDATGRAVSLDGGNVVRHFAITNGSTLRLINLTLANGFYQGTIGQTNQSGDPGLGGSICNSGGRLELMDCTFLSNRVVGGTGGVVTFNRDSTAGGLAFGGAVYSTNGYVWLTNCVFANNTCTGGQGAPALDGNTGKGGNAFGGAIYMSNGQTTLMKVTFTNNLCRGGELSGGTSVHNGGGGSFGGALADAVATTAITNCVFVSNQTLSGARFARLGAAAASANGGAIFHGSGSMTIEGTLFTANKATGGRGVETGFSTWVFGDAMGGGVFNDSGNLAVRNSAFILNQAIGGTVDCCQFTQGGDGSGGAIYNKATLAVINCTLAENSANGGGALASAFPTGGSAYGGAIAIVNGGSASLVNVTIADNSVDPGEGSTDLTPPPKAQGASISITTGTASFTNTIVTCFSSQTNVSGLIQDGGHNICSDASANFSSTSSYNKLNPLLGSLGDNGGSTPTLSLLPGSPAIDSGDDFACPPTDQRGVARPQGLACDIGAFELTPTLTLARGQDGTVRIEYSFGAGMTNRITASTNLINWGLLGTKVSDVNGVIEFEDTDAASLSHRFYQVQIQR